jgi:UDP-N-acetyl-2-amino-2-deoxyglucuronate dehydrogenase
MKNFALIGAAGYIAKRHVEAINDNNGDLLMISDPNDNVGYIDRFFPNSLFFKEIERFDRELSRYDYKEKKIDYVSICSPNYLHDSHIRLALRNNCNVICEKPLVLKTEHLKMLLKLEEKFDRKIYTILQLRHHDVIKSLKLKMKNSKSRNFVDLEYITPRGKWYDYSWKGNFDKSGGVLFNIGIHFFDMLIWLFGPVTDYKSTIEEKSAYGLIKLKNADVKFKLSIKKEDLPYDEWKPYRSLVINDEKFDFSDGFTDLHTKSYNEILSGNGYGIKDVYPAIQLIENMLDNG